jgi:predicted dehydrogenase
MNLRIGIVGTGRTIGVASDHLHGIQANSEWDLTAVFDIAPENAKRWVEQHNLASTLICSSLEELLDKVDAVVICTDNLSHGTIAREAFKRKLPVLCEKPLSVNYYESKKLVEEAEAAGVVNYMGMQYRYHPYAQLIKEKISSGELGDIFSYRHKLGGGRIGNPNVGLEWRMKKETSGAGAVADFGIHQVDLIHFFLHETCGEITSVQAELATFIDARSSEGSSRAPVTNDDLAVVIARLKNGAMITLNNSRLLPQDGDGLEIVGTKAALTMDMHGWIFLRKKNADGSWSGKREELEIEERHKFPGLARGKQYKEFYEAVKNNQPHELSFAYAAQAARVIETAVLSSQEGRRVSVSEIE